MFTGIIETVGKIVGVEKEQSNIHFWVESDFTNELKVDQSVAHNGVCLTVVALKNNHYMVTAILETLRLTNLNSLKENSLVNLERCLRLGDRLDGHIVQGHVDQTARCTSIKNENGSWLFTFKIENPKFPIINKGSITVNGTSLTVVNPSDDSSGFSVAIIPYTYENTIFHTLKENDVVNIEFDIIGKYAIKQSQLNTK